MECPPAETERFGGFFVAYPNLQQAKRKHENEAMK
jgi:hypothetical protein